jgi:ABC-type sulfate transport system permease subunit
VGGYWGAKRLVQVVAIVLAVLGAWLMLVMPSYGTASMESGGTETFEMLSMLDAVGPAALGLAAVPVAIALLPLVGVGRAWQPLSIASSVLMGCFVVLGILSVGFFYVPALLAGLVAVFLEPRGVRRLV